MTLVVATTLFLLAACSKDSAAPPAPSSAIKGYPQAELRIARRGQQVAVFRVDIAETDERRALGLMNVKTLRQGSGVVFLFPSETNVPFHMKDTLVPLDIAFWGSDGRIIDILQMTPCTAAPCQTYQSSAAFVGALEVNKGDLVDEGVVTGDVISLRRLDRQGS